MLAGQQSRLGIGCQKAHQIKSRSSRLICSAVSRQPNASSQPALAAAAAAAAAVIQLTSSSAAFAAPLYDNLPGFGADSQDPFMAAVQAQRQARGPGLDELFDENLATEPLRKFVDSVLNNKLKAEDIGKERLKMGFRRELDGRVSLRSREGRWYNVRPDMQVPGFLLLRDSNNGTIFFLPPADEYDGLQQLDLSDDIVVAELFSNTAWQDVMAPISVRTAGSADVQPLKLSERDFRQAVSLLADAEEPEDEEEEELQGQR